MQGEGRTYEALAITAGGTTERVVSEALAVVINHTRPGSVSALFEALVLRGKEVVVCRAPGTRLKPLTLLGGRVETPAVDATNLSVSACPHCERLLLAGAFCACIAGVNTLLACCKRVCVAVAAIADRVSRAATSLGVEAPSKQVERLARFTRLYREWLQAARVLLHMHGSHGC